MHRPRACRQMVAALGLALALVLGMPGFGSARAEPGRAGATATIRNSDGRGHRVIPRSKRAVGASEGSSGWWLASAGIALALAAFGGLSLAARRFLPAGASGSLRVIGRAGLSPKHSVYLLQVGDRVLILGAGPQGPPALLGELDEWPNPGRPIGVQP